MDNHSSDAIKGIVSLLETPNSLNTRLHHTACLRSPDRRARRSPYQIFSTQRTAENAI
ncbi:hypothetical protein BofuT4_P056070.1 [Botrytis cinerea T4]|uniref:Uncharacterized protein n=1 Tax=Botryotinia fuckeliana (strain T4) TaxID=999810 RepID=G2XW36_BOTF4|nr:hypothetical protein BofuT4_P056070.1 [Botrytis cinerea T4]